MNILSNYLEFPNKYFLIIRFRRYCGDVKVPGKYPEIIECNV